MLFNKQYQAKIGKKLKAKQHLEAESLPNISKKKVCLFQWNHMNNCNENGKIDHIYKTQ